MPVVTFDYEDFKNLLGYDISKEEIIEKMPMIGADFDKVEGNQISIEFFPNRPDLTSVEGIARAARNFFGFEKGLKKYKLQKSDIITTVDSSVKKVRPYISTGLVKNIKMTDELIASLMDLQEKLHFGLGRGRKKVAIGVHNFEPVIPPFTYKAIAPDAIQFIPLAKDEYMTLGEILKYHEKGVDYAHILKDFDKYPIILDSNNNVLSFPPIINGNLTQVTPHTKDIFVDVTGTDKKAVNYALNIVITALAERGGDVFTTLVKDKNEIISPDFKPQKSELSIDYVNNILGTTLTEKQIIDCLSKMGYDCTQLGCKKIKVDIPAWRSDILHDIDLVEDVAIGYGYDKFTMNMSKSLTFGGVLKNKELYDSLREIMIGLGFNEVTTFTISNKVDEYKKLGLKEKECIEIENPIGEEYSTLRANLLSSLLKIIRDNKHHSLPQNIFELGIVVDKNAKNQFNLAGVKIDAKANFTESKSIVEAIMRNIGLKFEIKENKHPAFIEGRCALILVNKKEVGYFGELHPKTILNFELEHPTIAFEIKADLL